MSAMTILDAEGFIEYRREIHDDEPTVWASSDQIESTYEVIAMYLGDDPSYNDVTRLAFLVHQQALAMDGN